MYPLDSQRPTKPPPIRHTLRPAVPSLIETVQQFESAARGGRIGLLRLCLHDKAMVETVASRGTPLGPDATADAVRTALDRDPFYHGDHSWEYEEVAPNVVLAASPVRKRSPHGDIDHYTAWRLATGRKGLIWRQKLFDNRADALAYLERHGTRLGL
jgi:hypothetical protein